MMIVPEELMQRIVDETNVYLDELQDHNRIWDEFEGHLYTSYIAEGVGDNSVARKHVQAAVRILGDIA